MLGSRPEFCCLWRMLVLGISDSLFKSALGVSVCLVTLFSTAEKSGFAVDLWVCLHMGEMRVTPEGKYFLSWFHQRLPCVPRTAFRTAAVKEKHFQRTSHVKKTPQLYAACKSLFSPAFPEVCRKHLVPDVTSNLPWQNSCRSLKAPGWHRSCLAITQRRSKDLKVARRAPGRARYSSAARSKGKIKYAPGRRSRPRCPQAASPTGSLDCSVWCLKTCSVGSKRPGLRRWRFNPACWRLP